MTSTLVAVPGTLCSPEIFTRLAGELRDEITVEAVDWMTEPGPWGIEDIAGRLAARIERDHGAPVLVAGHSTGGSIALTLAAARSDLVAGLLLANTGAHMRGHGDVDRILDTIATAWGPKLHAAVLDRSFAEPVPARFRDSLLAYAATVQQEAALDVLRSQRDLDLTARLPHIACPVTVLHGVLDRARSVADAEYLVAHLPNCALRTVHTGHSPVWEDVRVTAAAVRALNHENR